MTLILLVQQSLNCTIKRKNCSSGTLKVHQDHLHTPTLDSSSFFGSVSLPESSVSSKWQAQSKIVCQCAKRSQQALDNATNAGTKSHISTWWSTFFKTFLFAGQNSVTKYNADTQALLDIVFSFDTTGSMYKCLGLVRTKIEQTVRQLLQDVPGMIWNALKPNDEIS